MVTNSGIDQNWKEDKRRIPFSATTAKYSTLQITDVKVTEKVSCFFLYSVGDHVEQVWPFIFAICYFWQMDFKAQMYIKNDQQQ